MTAARCLGPVLRRTERGRLSGWRLVRRADRRGCRRARAPPRRGRRPRGEAGRAAGLVRRDEDERDAHRDAGGQRVGAELGRQVAVHRLDVEADRERAATSAPPPWPPAAAAPVVKTSLSRRTAAPSTANDAPSSEPPSSRRARRATFASAGATRSRRRARGSRRRARADWHWSRACRSRGVQSLRRAGGTSRRSRGRRRTASGASTARPSGYRRAPRSSSDCAVAPSGAPAPTETSAGGTKIAPPLAWQSMRRAARPGRRGLSWRPRGKCNGRAAAKALIASSADVAAAQHVKALLRGVATRSRTTGARHRSRTTPRARGRRSPRRRRRCRRSTPTGSCRRRARAAPRSTGRTTARAGTR